MLESLVVSGALTHPARQQDFYPIVESHWFEHAEHRLLWQALYRVEDKEDTATAAALYSVLSPAQRETLSLARIHEYLDTAAEQALAERQWRQLIEEWIREKAGEQFRKQLRSVVDDERLDLSASMRSVHEALETAAHRGEGANARPTRGYGELMRGFLTDLADRARSGSSLVGLPSGFDDYDNLTLGLEPGSLIIIAARPSMGKTALALGMTEHLGRNGHPVLMFSLEMPAEQLVGRSLSSLSGVDLQALRSGRMTEADTVRLKEAAREFDELPIHVDDTAGLDIDTLCARAHALHQREHLSAIFVDYLQLIDCTAGHNRTEQISTVSRKLKGLSKTLGVPVIALSQLNRSLEQRADKRPIMSDLRESGQIEQDADIIAFLYRDEVYNPDSPDRGLAELILGKQRNGPVDTVRLRFDGPRSRFLNLHSP